ncbi:MAG: MBL fold metallo-hydrolase [Bradyrhizobiaceae bacterium]|nr:MBL fold metallo-hydrolase [Bradyrhizobiaceae bacterium]
MNSVNRRTLLTGATALTAAALAPAGVATPARAAAPMSGKQAPGFYRYKVGDYEVTAITDGVRPTPLSDGYVRNQSRGNVSEALAALYPGHDKEQPVSPFTPVVVNTGSKLVVIDTGMGPTVFQQSKGALGQFHTNLEAAGIDRNAVDTVIISHFHGDHIGGLLNADGKPAFPNAEVMVPTPEWAHWMDDAKMNAAPEAARGGFQNVRRVFGALGKQVTQYEAGKEIAPGITAIASPGHTPGHTSHIVASGSGRVLVQADITAGTALLFVRNPGWHASFDADGALAEQTRRKLYDMAIAEKLLIQGFHFPFPAAGHVEKDGDGYRMTPIAWNAVL